jgi:hypothetical protein
MLMMHFTEKVITELAIYLRFQILILGMITGMVLIPWHTAMAQCTSMLKDGDFEEQRRDGVSTPWNPEGRAGIDRSRGLSFRGHNNAWARNNTGWNAIRQRVFLAAGVPYTLKAFVRTSGNVGDGYFGFRDASQHPVSEIKFGPLAGYKELSVQFRPARADSYYVFTGFWAPNQDAWIQVDFVRVESPCNDVDLNPVN